MAKFIRALLLIVFCCGLSVAQQIQADAILLKDATVIKAFNVEVAGNWVLYTLEESADSQLQRIAKDKVFAIKEANGELRSISSADNDTRETAADETAADDAVSPSYVAPKASDDNAAVIAQYNAPILQAIKERSQDSIDYCPNFVAIWGITAGSILSDENISVSFERVKFNDPIGSELLDTPEYKIILSNKTNSALYVDLANSFKINNYGTSEPYFSNASYSEQTGKSNGASLNLGAVAGALGVGGPIGSLANGVNVGSMSGNSASITKTEQRFLIIPANSSVALPPIKYTDNGKIKEAYESLYYRTYPIVPLMNGNNFHKFASTSGFYYYLHTEDGVDDASITKEDIRAPLGLTRLISEEESPKKLRRLITYSASPDFEKYTTLDFTLYIRGVMGSSQRWNVPLGYNPKYVETSDLDHLLYGVGQVKKKLK